MRSMKEQMELSAAVSDRTVEARIAEWVRNLVHNEERIKKGKKIIDYHRRLVGVPAVIVGAGPSLDKNIKLLGALKDRAFIISSDTIAKHIKKYVIPDMIVTLDSHKEISDYLDYSLAESSILLCETTAHPSVFDKWTGEVIWYLSALQGVKYFDKIIERDFNNNEQIGRILSGGCVVNAGIYLAKVLLGCDPIIILGADCGFYDFEKTHAQDLTNELKEGFKSYSETEVHEDIFGKNMFTTHVALMYKFWAENFAVMNEDPINKGNEGIYINATEGGLISKGWLTMRLKTVIQNYLPKKYNFSDFMDLTKKIEGIKQDPQKIKRVTQFTGTSVKEVETVEGKI